MSGCKIIYAEYQLYKAVPHERRLPDSLTKVFFSGYRKPYEIGHFIEKNFTKGTRVGRAAANDSLFQNL